jgi:microsomal prostaglandin-E synthase 2
MSEAESGIQATKVPERVVEGKPTLYAFESCPFCWKVRSLLAWKGVDYHKVEVDPMKKAELKWSEWTAVPVFVASDGTQVNDSNDILHYINSNYGGGEKFPEAGSDASQDQWMGFSGDILGKSILPVIYNSYRSSRKALSYVSEVESFGGFQKWKAIWLGGIVMRMIGKSRGKLFDLPAEENLQYQLGVMAEGFNGDFFGGDVPNGSDFANYGILRSMQGLRGWDIVKSHAQAGPWFARMQSTTGV